MLGLMLQTGSVAGFQDLLNKLNDIGFFQYVLPFLLIFAVVYAILTVVPTFKDNKGASIIIAIAIGLLSLQFNIVPEFFQNVFPKFGIGISLLILIMIFMGAVPWGTSDTTAKWIIFGAGIAIFIFITLASLSDWNFVGNFWWQQYGAMIIVAAIVIAAIVLIIKITKTT